MSFFRFFHAEKSIGTGYAQPKRTGDLTTNKKMGKRMCRRDQLSQRISVAVRPQPSCRRFIGDKGMAEFMHDDG
jgi:hypothetical protein